MSYIDILARDRWLYDEPLSKHTTFKIGGPADALALPQNEDEARSLISWLARSGTRYMIIGNGSNLLFSDKGFRGVIVKISGNLADLGVNGTILTAGAGSSLSSVAEKALRHSLSGAEALSGIPGSTGGAAFMNAGAYGAEVKDIFLDAVRLQAQRHHEK